MMACRRSGEVIVEAPVDHPVYICIEQPLTSFFLIRVKNVAMYQNIVCSHVKILMLGDSDPAISARYLVAILLDRFDN